MIENKWHVSFKKCLFGPLGNDYWTAIGPVIQIDFRSNSVIDLALGVNRNPGTQITGHWPICRYKHGLEECISDNVSIEAKSTALR